MRQALAGMLWSKQYFYFDVDFWLTEHGIDPLKRGGRFLRNREWFHMIDRRAVILDAGQVGVSLVCGMGPRIPLRCIFGNRSGLHPEASSTSCCRGLHPSDRSDAGLRVELQ